jgi:dihydrofolate reductase
MRKVTLSNMVTLDGFFEGPNRELEWHVVDEEFNGYANDLLSKVDAILFGRVTYQLMADYWPSPSATRDDPIIVDKTYNLPKIVFSKTLQKVEWNNSRLVEENIAEEISKMKQQPGKDILICGSADLVHTLMQHNLIDCYRIMVHPVILGSGKRLFIEVSIRKF